mgnify:CR=1 FL=1
MKMNYAFGGKPSIEIRAAIQAVVDHGESDTTMKLHKIDQEMVKRQVARVTAYKQNQGREAVGLFDHREVAAPVQQLETAPGRKPRG